ncbi:MAG: heavy metal-binding domain-containing protein [Acidobacteriota bacterium]
MKRLSIIIFALFTLFLLVSKSALVRANFNQKSEQKSEEKSQGKVDEDAEFMCTMHPEVRTKTKGKCPKCAMPLVSIYPDVVDDFILQMEANPLQPKPGEKLKLRFTVINPKSGKQVQEFALLHEKLFHVFVVSQDLSQFQHIHPAFNKDGSFTIETQLPKPGRYKIYSDFYPLEGSPQVLQKNIATAGYQADLFGAKTEIKVDHSLSKIFSGEKILAENAENIGVDFAKLQHRELNPLQVEIKIEEGKIIAGRQTTLKYHLTDAKTGEPIHDLSPYLGAWGHTLILSDDQTDYVHSHPVELPPDPFDTEITNEKLFFGGPNVTFEALFPREGNYRIWTQFLRGDEIFVVIFNVRAERLR